MPTTHKQDFSASKHPQCNLERAKKRGAADYSPQLSASHQPAEQPQTPALTSIPRFFYTNTCSSCLDPVATGNQIAESELRKPHPLSPNPPGATAVELRPWSVSAASHPAKEVRQWNQGTTAPALEPSACY